MRELKIWMIDKVVGRRSIDKITADNKDAYWNTRMAAWNTRMAADGSKKGIFVLVREKTHFSKWTNYITSVRTGYIVQTRSWTGTGTTLTVEKRAGEKVLAHYMGNTMGWNDEENLITTLIKLI